jgi:O-antigen/teichoic acid export membrane protein
MSSTGSGSLTRLATRAVGFQMGGNAFQLVLSLTLGVALARLLPPREFGLFGFAAALVVVTEIVASWGMLRALVFKKDPTLEEEGTGAILLFLNGLLMAGILFFAAPWAERAMDMPGLALIMQLQAAVLLLRCLALLPESRLTRRMAFDRLALTEGLNRLLGGILSIILAVYGFGALSLALGSLLGTVIRSAMLWGFVPGPLPISFKFSHVKELSKYGVGFLGIDMANNLTRQADVLIIGQQLGSEAVGLYRRAFQLVMLPLQQITSSANRVLFPAMASIKEEHEKFRRSYLAVVSLSALIAYPTLTWLWTTAAHLIPLVYGPMWTATVPVLQILSFAAYFRIAYNSQGLVVQSKGRGGAEALLQFGYLGLIILFVLVGSRWGVLGVAMGVSAAAFLFFISMTRLSLAVVGVTLREWLGAMRTGLLGCLAMAATILGLQAVLVGRLSDLPLLVILTASGGIVYLILIRLLLTAEERLVLDRITGVLPLRLRKAARLLVGTSSKESSASSASLVGQSQTR